MNAHRLLFLPVALLLAASLCAVPRVAVAAPPQGASDPPTLIKHLRSEIRSKDADRQERALVDVVALAACSDSCTVSLLSAGKKRLRMENETGMGAAIDLDALVPDLLQAYRRGLGDGHRLLALSALINIGSEAAMEQLIAEKETQGSNVRKATDRSLAAFYLTKYPDLTERTLRTKRLSVEDVQRSEALRVRLLRKDAKERGRSGS